MVPRRGEGKGYGRRESNPQRRCLLVKPTPHASIDFGVAGTFDAIRAGPLPLAGAPTPLLYLSCVSIGVVLQASGHYEVKREKQSGIHPEPEILLASLF